MIGGYRADLPAAWGRLFDEIAGVGAGQPGCSRENVLRSARDRLAAGAGDWVSLNLLALDDLRRQRADHCLRRLEGVPAAIEGDALANRLMGDACWLTERWGPAGVFYRRALRLSPHQADAWVAVGILCEVAGQRSAALGYYQRGRFFEDSRHEATRSLARLLTDCRKLQAAVKVFREAIGRDRRSAVLHTELARSLRRLASRARRRGNSRAGRVATEQAVGSLRVAIAAEGTVAQHHLLAMTLQELGRFDEAHQALSEAWRRHPGNPKTLTRLACLNIDEGRVDLGERQLLEVLRDRPGSGIAHFRLSRIGTHRRADIREHSVESVEALLEGDGRSRQERIHLHFAAGKLYDDREDFDRAWAHYKAGNRLKPGHSCDDDRPRHLSRVRRYASDQMATIDADFIRRRADWGETSEMPIFVIGMPRSGTTLVEQILSSHPEIAGAGELSDIEQLRHQVVFDHRKGEGRCYRRDQLEGIREVGREGFRQAARAYLGRLANECGPETRRVVDKMPTNFWQLGWIATLFPKATVIHCKRHPLDVLVSSYCQNLNPPFCDLEVLAEYYAQYRRVMRHWERVLPLAVHDVRYESLVRDPEAEIRSLVMACGVDWDPSCIEFHKNRRAVRTPSKWQVRQPMYVSSVGHWRRFERHLAEIRDRVAEIEAAFGEEFQAGP